MSSDMKRSYGTPNNAIPRSSDQNICMTRLPYDRCNDSIAAIAGDHTRIVTRYVGSGVRRVGSGIITPASLKPWDRDEQFFLGIRDQSVPFLWDQ